MVDQITSLSPFQYLNLWRYSYIYYLFFSLPVHLFFHSCSLSVLRTVVLYVFLINNIFFSDSINSGCLSQTTTTVSCNIPRKPTVLCSLAPSLAKEILMGKMTICLLWRERFDTMRYTAVWQPSAISILLHRKTRVIKLRMASDRMREKVAMWRLLTPASGRGRRKLQILTTEMITERRQQGKWISWHKIKSTAN